MARRSLRASAKGIQKAKLALERKNLTQKAIAYELAIAAWATVNKFFNGKPVERPIFLEICEQLELDWQEIAENPVRESETTAQKQETAGVEFLIAGAIAASDNIYAIVQVNAQRTRTALDPYILPLVRRETLLEKCLKQIRIGAIEGKRRVIPILGAAGYGKSTILGLIYDELSQELRELGKGWITLARCDDLIESVDSFATELGEKISNQRESIVEIAKRLTEERERGILLIDTLDIVLTKPLVPVLRHLFLQLLELGTTIVFTCRDADYSNFFEPYHESFAGFRECVQDGCKITLFEETEVKQAARKFVELRLGYTTAESQNSFADKIIALSADSVSLQEIVRNPLLLALLCDLFAESENVPEDLTVSQLYEKYWDWKITTVRQNWQSQHLGMAKERLCLKIAATLYKNSGECLRDFAYENNLELNETEFLAYTSLKSDGILKDLGASRVGFFHQTFLEYAIARWLNSTESGEIAKDELKNDIITTQLANSRYYIWPIFRQLLTLVTLAEFYHLVRELDKTILLPFRSVAFASVSRIEPESSTILLELLEIALIKDFAFQETLLSVANSAPRRHSTTVWEVVVTLLANVGKELINRATEITADLLSRLETPRSQRFEQALTAIQNLAVASESSSIEDRYHVWGKFIGHYYNNSLKLPNQAIEVEILLSLKKRYFEFGSNLRSIVVELYLKADIPEALKTDFCLMILSRSPSESFKEKWPSIELLSQLLPNWILADNSGWGSTFWSALHTPLDKRWMEVSATAIGRIAATQTELLHTITYDLFSSSQQPVSPDSSRSNLIALTTAIEAGGANSVASLLLKIPTDNITASRISTLVLVFRSLAESNPTINAELQVKLVEWITPLINQYPIDIMRGIDILAVKFTSMQPIYGQLLAKTLPILPTKKSQQILAKIKYIPAKIIPYLQDNIASKECRVALLKIYEEQANQDIPEAISKLLQLCRDASREVALDASWAILKLVEQQKTIETADLLNILAAKSPVVGVRQNILQAFITIANTGIVSTADYLEAFQILSPDSAPEVINLLYKLAETSIWNSLNGMRDIDAEIAQAVFNLTQRIVAENNQSMISMITQSAFITLNQMTVLQKTELISLIIISTRNLLRLTDISRKIDKSIVTGLLSKLAKFKDDLLTDIVREDMAQLPVANQVAIIVAIAHSQGKNSALLDKILQSNIFPDEVKSRIIRERGV